MDAQKQLATMSRWYVVSRAIHTVARLGLANYMSLTTPITAQKLAKATNTHDNLLERLLNFLCAYDIFTLTAQGYLLTEMSVLLQDEHPQSIRAVISMVDEYWWQAFSQLENSLKSGNSAFWDQHQDHFFSFLSKDNERQKNFDCGMAKLSSYDDEAVSLAYNFSQFNNLVDMGGGLGGLSKRLNQHYPQLKIILFDTPFVIDQLHQTKYPENILLQSGDFLTNIPQADAYLFKGVLHDFSDELMFKILNNCANQMPKNAKLLIAEQVLPESPGPHPNKTMDIVMMVLLGGRQRSDKEWRKCIEPCGFTFQQSYPSKSLLTLMEFKLT